MDKLIKKLGQINVLIYVFMSNLIILFFTLVISTILKVEVVANGPISKLESELPIIVVYLLLIFLMPIVETYVFQKLIIDFILKKKGGKGFAILISAIVFSIFHYYSFTYIFMILPIGIVLATSYVVYKYSKKINPFFVVFIIHMINNIMAVL